MLILLQNTFTVFVQNIFTVYFHRSQVFASFAM